MTENIFFIATIVSIVFIIIKSLEMKFIESEHKKPLKYLVRDSIIVYFSVFLGIFIINQIYPSINKITQPSAFLSEPTF